MPLEDKTIKEVSVGSISLKDIKTPGDFIEKIASKIAGELARKINDNKSMSGEGIGQVGPMRIKVRIDLSLATDDAKPQTPMRN